MRVGGGLRVRGGASPPSSSISCVPAPSSPKPAGLEQARVIGSPKRKSFGLGASAGPRKPSAAPPDDPPCAVSAAKGAPAPPPWFSCEALPNGSSGWPAAPTSPRIAPWVPCAACAACAAGVSGRPGVESCPLAREILRSRCRLFWNHTCTCRGDTLSCFASSLLASRPGNGSSV